MTLACGCSRSSSGPSRRPAGSPSAAAPAVLLLALLLPHYGCVRSSAKGLARAWESEKDTNRVLGDLGSESNKLQTPGRRSGQYDFAARCVADEGRSN